MKCNINRGYTQKDMINALCKMQWIMIYSYYEALGIGQERVLKVIEKLNENIEEYGMFKSDGIQDEMLERALLKSMPNIFSKLYNE